MSDSNLLSTARVEAVLRSTLKALEQGKSQMYDIAEHARQEYYRLQAELEQVKQAVSQAIRQVESLDKQFKQARTRLYEISRDFEHYSEGDQAQAYKEAERVRESLAVAQERERNLRLQRKNLEISLNRMDEIASKAERFVSQVGVALAYLEGNLRDVNDEIENVQLRYEIRQGILKGQENERRRLAREIHDGPVQDLANIMIKLDICERLYGIGRQQEAVSEYRSVKTLIQSVIGDVRRIIYDLSPLTLEDLGLVHTAMRYVKESCDQYGVDSEVLVVGQEVRLDDAIEVALFRTIQEAVSNSLRHGRPTQVTVRIEFGSEWVRVGVFDNGIGFDMEDVQNRLHEGRHYGLIGMQDRIKLLNGSFSLNSTPGQGTRLVASIPLHPKESGGDKLGSNKSTNRR
ncbi:MAG: histidine kinase [Firmicutes bacterium]|nr:histidine kinase [Bacillota bacterium]